MKNLKQNIISMYSDNGKQWLDSFPRIIANIEKEHNLSGLTPVDNMTFNYVASDYQNDKLIILKIGLNSRALAKEAYITPGKEYPLDDDLVLWFTKKLN